MIGMLLPKVIGTHADPHTWHIHEYKGIGKLPTGLSSSSDPAKRALLNQLPRIIRGYGRTPGIDAVVVVLDTDQRDCAAFLSELKAMLRSCNPAPKTIFRLAIEEMESWFLGDSKLFFLRIQEQEEISFQATNRTASVELGNYWQMQSTLEDPRPSSKRDGRCLAKSSMLGLKRYAQKWILKSISLQASASSAMGYVN